MSDAATRTAYDTVAADYAELVRDELADKPFDRALLAAFAEQTGRLDGPVLEVGCGPGRNTAHLAGLGVRASGVDLSPAMVRVARQTYPGLEFHQGSLFALDTVDASLAGIVAWYSLIRAEPRRLPLAALEFARALLPGGILLLAFQSGDGEVRHITHAYGHDVSMDAYAHSAEHVTDTLAAAGLPVTAQLTRQPVSWERHPQTYLVATRTPSRQ